MTDMNRQVIRREGVFRANGEQRLSLVERSFANRLARRHLAVLVGDIVAVWVLEDLVDQDLGSDQCADVWLRVHMPYADVLYRHVHQIMPGDLKWQNYGGKYILLQKVAITIWTSCTWNHLMSTVGKRTA